MNWNEWKTINKNKIQHIVGFEEKFVDDVLSKIPLILPEDVIPQYPFTDAKGIDRQIDFMIINNTKGYLLPIELDGYSKLEIEKGYHKFNNLLERQNSLIAKFGTLLRYTNKKMLNESQYIIQEITEILKQQAQRKQQEEQLKQLPKDEATKAYQEFLVNLEHMTKKNTEEYYKKIIEELQIKEQSAQLNENHKQTSELQATIDLMKDQLHQLNHELKNQKTSKNIHITRSVEPSTFRLSSYKSILMSLIILGAGAFGYTQFKTPDIVSQDKPNQLIGIKSTTTESPLKFIKAVEAKNYVGQTRTFCGRLQQIKPFAKGEYLNLDRTYPNQSLTVVVWSSDAHKFSPFNQSMQKVICINGEVSAYKNKPQIILRSVDQLSFQ